MAFLTTASRFFSWNGLRIYPLGSTSNIRSSVLPIGTAEKWECTHIRKGGKYLIRIQFVAFS